MNPVYLRVAIYVIASTVASLGLGHFDAEAMTLTLDLNQIALSLGGGGAVSAAVFAIWGKR